MSLESSPNLDQNVVPTPEKISNDRSQKQENVESEAMNVFVTELMQLFDRGVSMGFLVKRGDNYHWNVDGEEYCYQM